MKMKLPACQKAFFEALGSQDSDLEEPITSRILRVQQDLSDLNVFYPILISPTRQSTLISYLGKEISSLRNASFGSYSQDEKVDCLLLRNFLRRCIHQLELDGLWNIRMAHLIPFAGDIVSLCEDRQAQTSREPRELAATLNGISKAIARLVKEIRANKETHDKHVGFRAAKTIDQLKGHLEEWYSFFKCYDPGFTWWVVKPFETLSLQLGELSKLIRAEIVGVRFGDEDAIIGEPIGRDGLLSDLKAEMIPYSPEELISIGEKEYKWCEAEIKKASRDLGYEDWHDGLEYVKNLYVEPGRQPQLIRFLSDEATSYVKKHELVTVPPIAELWTMRMMTPAWQKVNPFFLGGEEMIVSYPTSTMSHEDKMMSMRGNNIHFSRSTVFHEMIPGHHLQMHMISRHKPYRQLFDTPFWIEGWALYWEMILWNRGFPETAENKIGMLFWRMHRCARIIFSIKFHLGEMTPQECVDMLVDWVGHERATAEGEVRRSFNGDYTPLYQAGYMLGALQLMELRREVLREGKMSEKQFHDRVLRENEMPIEMLRALILEQKVEKDFVTSWRFYDAQQ